ncbi:MAG: MBL fold metallo-hydrolase [Gammaproteobacteria bacterium]|nr:MBL fold metallo-hydrolase [Gammaproteobacteria bacterium]
MTVDVRNFFHEPTNTITHVVWDAAANECAIIDPVLDFDQSAGRTGTAAADEVLTFVSQQELQVRYICETHVHADHLSAAVYCKEKTGAPVVIGSGVREVTRLFTPLFARPEDQQAVSSEYFDQLLADGEELPLGNTVIRCLFTPGHTPACVTYVVDDAAFVGDTLFMPDYGTARTDFPGGDAALLYRSIQRILQLPAATRLYMCHDYKAPGRNEYAWETTVAAQRSQNVHIKNGVSEADFVEFRTTRDAQLSVPALLLPSVQVNLRGGALPAPDTHGIRYLKIPLNQL